MQNAEKTSISLSICLNCLVCDLFFFFYTKTSTLYLIFKGFDTFAVHITGNYFVNSFDEVQIL